jgi:hypothetical protein
MIKNNLSTDNDMSDVCDLLGMSSIFNKDETKNDVNLKSVEKEFIKKSLDIDEDDTLNNELLTYNPINEYKNLINEISENKKEESVSDEDDMSEYNEIIEFASPNKKPSKSYDDDDFSYKLTQEQTNQKIVDKVLNFSDNNNDDFNIDDENREDLKLTLLEKIDNLTEELEDDGVNLNKIPKVDYNSDLDKIEYVAKLLMLKSNRNRYSNLGEEFILAVAGGLEILCDGKREFLGVKPNLVGYSDVVKVKLRRVKNDTSQIVSNVVEKYEMSPIMTLLIELVPSLFLHSRRRSNQIYDNLYNDLNEDISEIRKFNS